MDQQHISNLVFRYASLLDDGNFAAVAELFRDGQICTAQGDMTGYEAVLAMYQASTRLYPNGTPRTRHITSNLAIEVDGDTAICRSYFTVMQAVPPDFPLQAIICGHYHDELHKVNGDWQFGTRHIHPELLGDLSCHLLFDSSALDS
jgi:3-phenylpropionate/cinnamic acid dioxygenase small subunit